jgi:hypothetical protein
VLIALAGATAPVLAQQPVSREDLRCLTDEARSCLPKPVSRFEPHGGRCATCHDLSEQQNYRDAAKTCASANCHTQVDKLTPFHRGLRPSVLSNCVGCHDAHDSRIHSGDKSCNLCHDMGGSFRSAQPPRATSPGRVTMTDPVFRHEQHVRVNCTQCHGSGLQHASFNATRLQECRSCHHREPLVTNCRSCHDAADVAAISTDVKWTFAMELGSLMKPSAR